MLVVKTISELRSHVADWRAQGDTVALVPTMGNLHDGHLALVAEARRHAVRVVVSIFVNPLQFGENEDIDSYPRTFAEDRLKLEQTGVDLLFFPSVQEVYPAGPALATRVEVAGLGEILCGRSRPGHFAGVTTVVAKLFNMVGPDVAVFGEKDFQQLALIRTMVRDLDFPLQIVGVATQRELDGLAMSSRNAYLTPAQRALAPKLYALLQEMAVKLGEGRCDYGKLEEFACKSLEHAGFIPDYVAIRRASDLAEPVAGDTGLVILAAAWLGKARLIDNLQVTLIKTD